MGKLRLRIEEGAQRIDKNSLARHFLAVQILKFEDDGANPLMRKRDVLERFDDEGEAQVDGGLIFLNFPDCRNFVELGIDLHHSVALRVRSELVGRPQYRLVVHQTNPGIVVP